jgi:hypothetical protein
LWPEPVRVTLSPGHADAARLSRLRAGKALRSAARDLDDPGWKPAAAQAVPLIASLGVARASASVVLSNRFVRYLLLPWSPALRTHTDWQAFGRQRLSDVYGSEAAACSILVSGAGRAARVACAVDIALVEALRGSLAAAGHLLVSLRPRFSAWFDAGRRRAPGDAWFVDHDGGQLTLGLSLAGEWRCFRQRRAGPDWQAELGSLLDREAALCGARDVERAVIGAPADDLPQRLGRYAVSGMAAA